MYTCITCPLGCDIELVDKAGEIGVSGNLCERGKTYAENEYSHPKRMLTSTVRITGAHNVRLPVISRKPIEKDMLVQAFGVIYKTVAEAPVKMGDVVIENICGSGVDIVASRDVDPA